jgi:fatty acid CoA ligase FadD9
MIPMTHPSFADAHADQLPPPVRRILELTATDPELASLMPEPGVDEALRADNATLESSIRAILDGYASRPALGQRRYSVVTDGEPGRSIRRPEPAYKTITYGELHRRVKQLALAWREDGPGAVRPGDFVCILGFSGVDYVTADLACAYAHAVCVPLQPTMASADIDLILDSTQASVLVVTASHLGLASQLAIRSESVRCVIAMDYDGAVDRDRESLNALRGEVGSAGKALRITTLDELIAGAAGGCWEPLPADAAADERVAVLLHSSGSTGAPKGAIYLERKVRRTQFAVASYPAPVIRLSFLPLNHQAGRRTVYNTLARGGTLYFTANADMSTLFDDIRLVRPTELFFFPRALEMIRRHYENELARRAQEGLSPDQLADDVLAEMRSSFLGDRVCVLGVGSAPTTPDLKRFVERCFELPLVEGYGSTEGGSITANDRVMRPPIQAYRLRDVPELGYLTTDQPFPRGELCIQSEDMITGYFKRPDATAALFDDDGYLLTGDIAEERGRDHIVLIDRRNDVLKLAQGEYVAVGALTAAYERGSELIHQIYIHGSSDKSYLLAVAVPDGDAVRARLGEVPGDPGMKALLRADLDRVAQEAGFKPFEVPRDILIEREPFSMENGLLSPLGKRIRTNFAGRYGVQLDALYAMLDRGRGDHLAALRGRSDLATLDKIGLAMRAVLGVQDVDASAPVSFVQLGGDSLAAAELSVLIEDTFGVELPVHAILSATGSPSRWAELIDASLAAGAGSPTSSAVHGPNARRLSSADLKLDRFIDLGDRAPLAAHARQPRTPVVLLTGATGFLGRFLCLTWLERLAETGGTLVCLVRGRNAADAASRLIAVFQSDPGLAERFARLADAHLEVVAGDVASRRLGLTDAEFDRLSWTVDRIVHPAALVNHVLDYEHLFGPNVVGTAEVIRLALSRREKTVDFVSSMATAQLVDRADGIRESSELLAEIELTGDYGVHYAASKWAAELLLHDAHRRFGLPVRIYRGDMMLPHTAYAGQINVPDLFTRQLYSLAVAGLAPRSFYRDERGVRPHYDGLPVDFVASAMCTLAGDDDQGLRTYHVLNHHDDGVSLDTFVDWVEDAGYPIARIDDYDDWLCRFESKLRALPADERGRSLLPVLAAVRAPREPWSPAGSRQFLAALEAADAALAVPHLTLDFIHKCVADLRAVGLLTAPARPGTSAG